MNSKIWYELRIEGTWYCMVRTDIIEYNNLVEGWMSVRERKRGVGDEGTYSRWRAMVISLAR